MNLFLPNLCKNGISFSLWSDVPTWKPRWWKVTTLCIINFFICYKETHLLNTILSPSITTFKLHNRGLRKWLSKFGSVRNGMSKILRNRFGIGSVQNLTNSGNGSVRFEITVCCAIWVTKKQNMVKFVCCGWWFSSVGLLSMHNNDYVIINYSLNQYMRKVENKLQERCNKHTKVVLARYIELNRKSRFLVEIQKKSKSRFLLYQFTILLNDTYKQ